MSFLIHNDITYDSFVHQNLCRLCWLPIAGASWLKSEHTTNDLFEKVLLCLGIDLQENMVPNGICDQCVQKLETFSEFKTSCLSANEKLRSIYLNHINCLDCIKKDDIKFESTESTPECSKFKPYNVETPIPLEIKVNEKLKDEKKTDRPKTYYKTKRSSTYCNICHTDLKSKEEYCQHNAIAHGIEDDGNTFKCFGCDRRFSTRKARLSHERNFCRGLHSGYKCNICNKHLQSRGFYECHIRMHILNKTNELQNTPGFICRKCGKEFAVKTDLDTHKLKEHAPVKRNYICEQCGQIFHRHDYLRKHRMIHGDIKNYSCSQCAYTTRQKSSLIVHIRKHTGERPFSCDLCDLKCVSSSNLLAHRRRHLGVKQHECTVCSKRFGYKTSLQDHMVSIHNQGDAVNRFFCEICGAIFPRPRGLQRHIKSKHKNMDKTDTKNNIEDKETSQLFGI